MALDPPAIDDRMQYHGPSPILDASGQPYRRTLTPADREVLSQEVAPPSLVGTRSFWDESVASGLTPGRLAMILRECVRGDINAYLTLAEEMEERDLNYAAALSTRKRALSRIKPTLDATGVELHVAEAVQKVIEGPAFHAMIKNALDAIGKGFSVNEIIWCARDGLWWPEGYRFRDPKYFTFDFLSRSELRLADLETMDGAELPPFKFIRHVCNIKSGIPIRGGMARTVAWAFMFKSFALKDWAAFLDVYGMPLRLGKYHPQATAGERSSLLRAVAGLASDAAAIIPESMAIEFVETKGGSERPFQALAEYLDDAIATVVLGQTLTTRDGGSLGQAKVHNEIRLDLAEDDAYELGITIDRDLIAPFVALNFGANVRAPRCEFRVPKPEVVSVLATALGVLVPLGLQVSQEDVRQKIGMPSPAFGAQLLQPAAPVAPLNVSPANTPLPGEAARPALNRVSADVAIETGGREIVGPLGLDTGPEWQAEAGPMLDAIVAAANTAENFGEFRASLKALYGGLPTADFTRRLARAAKAPQPGSEVANG